MSEVSRDMGNGVIYSKKAKEPIPENTIHIYPKTKERRKTFLGISRSFSVYLEDLGFEKLKRTPESKLDHLEFPAHVGIVGDELIVSFYYPDLDEDLIKSLLHNYMLTKLEAHTAEELEKRFDTVYRVPLSGWCRTPDRNPRIVRLTFDLSKAVIIGKKQIDVTTFFA